MYNFLFNFFIWNFLLMQKKNQLIGWSEFYKLAPFLYLQQKSWKKKNDGKKEVIVHAKMSVLLIFEFKSLLH